MTGRLSFSKSSKPFLNVLAIVINSKGKTGRLQSFTITLELQ